MVSWWRVVHCPASFSGVHGHPRKSRCYTFVQSPAGGRRTTRALSYARFVPLGASFRFPGPSMGICIALTGVTCRCDWWLAGCWNLSTVLWLWNALTTWSERVICKIDIRWRAGSDTVHHRGAGYCVYEWKKNLERKNLFPRACVLFCVLSIFYGTVLGVLSLYCYRNVWKFLFLHGPEFDAIRPECSVLRLL